MVFGKQALETFIAGGRADGVIDAVVFMESFNVDEIVPKIEVGPAVDIADGEVDFAVQAAQFKKALFRKQRMYIA